MNGFKRLLNFGSIITGALRNRPCSTACSPFSKLKTSNLPCVSLNKPNFSYKEHCSIIFTHREIRAPSLTPSVVPSILDIPVIHVIVPSEQNQINAPGCDNSSPIQAARLIVIRRRKMRRHKLKKLRKRMKFLWAKVRQRRELRKEKAFQAELIAQMREADGFDAASYVSEKLQKATEVPQIEKWQYVR